MKVFGRLSLRYSQGFHKTFSKYLENVTCDSCLTCGLISRPFDPGKNRIADLEPFSPFLSASKQFQKSLTGINDRPLFSLFQFFCGVSFKPQNAWTSAKNGARQEKYSFPYLICSVWCPKEWGMNGTWHGLTVWNGLNGYLWPFIVKMGNFPCFET